MRRCATSRLTVSCWGSNDLGQIEVRRVIDSNYRRAREILGWDSPQTIDRMSDLAVAFTTDQPLELALFEFLQSRMRRGRQVRRSRNGGGA